MKKFVMVIFTVLAAASLSFAQTGETAGRIRGGKGAFAQTGETAGRTRRGKGAFAQTGEIADRTRGGKGASNNSSNREHKGVNKIHTGGKNGNKGSSVVRKGWNQTRNARK